MGTTFIDKYTLLHFASGIIAYFFNIDLITWILIHTIFEFIENTNYGMYIINTYLKFWPGGKPFPDTIINNIGDTIGTISGWLLAYFIDNINISNIIL